MNNRLWTAFAAVLALIVGVFGGWLIWAGDDDSTAGTPITGDFPTGTYEIPGATVNFNDDGTCLFTGTGSDPWTMDCTFSVNGDLYTETTFDYPDGAQVPASYYWTDNDGELTFEVWGEDPRPSRAGAYSETFTKMD